jgi:fructokinase
MVSLDPNDGYMLDNVEKIIGPFVKRANLILPSEGEAKTLAKTKTDDEACRKWASEGKIVALKRGANGCTIYQADDVVHIGSFKVDEVDPTGCGDSFCAGFITGLIEELPLLEVGILANACGALQATELGPMEGAKTRDEVDKFIQQNRSNIEIRRVSSGY